MNGRAVIALVGDYSPDVTAHRAIPIALELASRRHRVELGWEWVPTRAIHDAARELARFAAVWVVPASPYENMAGALGAIRFARETKRPFLGTCGGFQHALIEIARDVAGIADADHAETNPTGESLVVTKLACSLVDKSELLHFASGSLVASAYGAPSAHEGYRCSYGVNESYRAALERAGLRFSAFDDSNAIRAAELPPTLHPFFVGTLFQPERAALRGETPPLVAAFAAAAARTQ